MSDARCQGCGAAGFDGLPIPQRCGNCPPEQCADCGQMDSATQPCKCWVSLEGMNLADLKGVFARGDLTITSAMGGGE